jgi:hypothetical protein
LAKSKNIERANLSMSEDVPKNLKRRRARLSKLSGVRAVGINYLTNTVYVEYDSGKISLEKIRTVLGRPSN